MIGAQTGKTGQNRWRLLLALLCVALVVFTGTLSVAHWHENDSIAHADCGLCATAHVTVQLATDIPAGPVIEVSTRVEASLPAIRPRTLSRFALFTRPPPVNAHLTS
jgi:hypothetical protein